MPLLEKDNSALIVIDVQENFLSKLLPAEREPLVERIAWIMNVAKVLEMIQEGHESVGCQLRLDQPRNIRVVELSAVGLLGGFKNSDFDTPNPRVMRV